MPFVPTASGVVPPAGWFPDIGRPEILPRQTTAAIPAIIFNTTGFFFFFKSSSHHYWLYSLRWFFIPDEPGNHLAIEA